MVSCCANPACRTEFRFIGDFYALERSSADKEFFWLCSTWVPVVAVGLDAMGGVSVRPRSDSCRPRPPHLDSRLRLVPRFSTGTYTIASVQSRSRVNSFGRIRAQSALFIMRSRINLATILIRNSVSERDQNNASCHDWFRDVL
jgi:hypothetical protein